MAFRFREVQEIKKEERGLLSSGIDPDKLIDPVDEILKKVQDLADQEWDKLVEQVESQGYDPDKLIF